jgi:cytochrome c556
MAFVDRVQGFLGRINGQVLRFPVPAGTSEGDRSVKEAVASGLATLIDEHRKAVAAFGEDTRDETIKRAAEKIRTTQFKVQAYAEYLADEKGKLDRALAATRDELRAKVEQLATASVA